MIGQGQKRLTHLRGKVWNNKPLDAYFIGLFEKSFFTVFEDDVVVGHKEKRNIVLFSNLSCKLETILDPCPIGQCLLVGLQNHRAVRHGFGKGDLHLNTVHAIFHHLFDHLAVDIKGWVAQHNMGHEEDIFLV